MGDFNRDRQGRGRSFGGNRGFGSRPSRPATMYKAVCGKCGKDCEIPFQPTGNRPVFCRDCFRDNAAAADTRPMGERSFSRPVNSDGNTEYSHLKDQLASVNAKLEKIYALLNKQFPQEKAKAPVADEVVAPIASAEAAVVAPEKKKKTPKSSKE